VVEKRPTLVFLFKILLFDIVEIIGRDAQAALVCFAVSV
jgi:hypothetical protein